MSHSEEYDAALYERTRQEMKLIVAQTVTEMLRPQYMKMVAGALVGGTLIAFVAMLAGVQL